MPPDVPFGSAAERYDALRPSYPDAAVVWALADAPAGDVADVGAGTGKLTGVLLGAGRGVRAIDPSDDLLRVLRRRHPDAQASVGTGERTGLPDDSVAAVVYGQSWHWVDGARATAEASRVLRPGGTLAMLWNDADVREPWVQRYQLAQRGLKQRPPATRRMPRFPSPDFQPREEWQVRWRRPLTKGALVDLVTTFSFFLTASPAARRARLAAVRAQLDADLPGPDDRPVEYPMITRVTRYRLTARAGRRKRGVVD